MIDEIFKKNKLKVTKQRREIIDIINNLDYDATINNIVKKANMDKSTVYRIIDILIKNNVLIKQINYNNDDYYILKEKHRHYVKCVKCNKITKLDKCPLDSDDINGFKIINHNVEIEGICDDCC